MRTRSQKIFSRSHTVPEIKAFLGRFFDQKKRKGGPLQKKIFDLDFFIDLYVIDHADTENHHIFCIRQTVRPPWTFLCVFY